MSKYLKKKEPLTAEQVEAIPPERIKMVFDQLETRMTKGQGQSTDGMEELLRKVAQHPQKFDFSKPYNLGGYSARYQYYKKLERIVG